MAGTQELIQRLRGSAFAFPLAAVVALGLLVISEISYRDATRSIERVEARQQARVASETVRRTIYEAESAHRGYLLTGRPDLLARVDAVRPQASRAIESLHRFYDGDPASAILVARLETALKTQFDGLRDAAGRAGDAGPATAVATLDGVAARAAAEARALADRLTTEEIDRIASSREELLRTMLLSRLGVGALVALSLLALSMYLRQKSTLERQVADEASRIAEQRDALEREAFARTAQLRELAQHLQTVREDERSRLARELHDELGALLTAAKLDAARLKSRLAAGPSETLDRLAHLNEQLNSGIALKRRIIEDLRPSSLSNLGLVAALEILLREWSQRTEIEVEGDLKKARLTPTAELTAFRFVQEALTNIAKYAKATHVQVRMAPGADDGSRVTVCVSDNGIGFDVEASNRGSTHGLLGMRYRVESEGGELTVNSRFGEGSTLIAHLPAAPRTPGVESDPAALSGLSTIP